MKPLILLPPVVAALLGGAMWLVHRQFLGARVEAAWLAPLALLLLAAGLILAVWAALSFVQHKTTINPMAPSRASNLITRGVYRVSRNPIYLGDLLILAAFAVWLGDALNIVFLIAFVWIMNRFQIAPEEQALRTRFGERYTAYCSRVRRWL